MTLYHGVTLGGIAPAVNAGSQVDQKRHPTIEDGAIIGSGAQILGPMTVGAGARVGANAVAVKDIPSGVSVVGIPARPIGREEAKPQRFAAYGTPSPELPDPVSRAIDELVQQVETLSGRLQELERRLQKHAEGAPEGLEAEREETKEKKPAC